MQISGQTAYLQNKNKVSFGVKPPNISAAQREALLAKANRYSNRGADLAIARLDLLENKWNPINIVRCVISEVRELYCNYKTNSLRIAATGTTAVHPETGVVLVDLNTGDLLPDAGERIKEAYRNQKKLKKLEIKA